MPGGKDPNMNMRLFETIRSRRNERSPAWPFSSPGSSAGLPRDTKRPMPKAGTARAFIVLLVCAAVFALSGCGRKTTEVVIQDMSPETVSAARSEAVRAGDVPEASDPTSGPESSGDLSADSPEDSSAVESYVVNRSSRVFHRPSCSSVGKIAEKNRLDTETTREDLIRQGFEPCKNCKP